MDLWWPQMDFPQREMDFPWWAMGERDFPPREMDSWWLEMGFPWREIMDAPPREMDFPCQWRELDFLPLEMYVGPPEIQ